ncbi:MAG: helix-turn-helix transcriptional regulator [Fuscovulum sp.]|nr:MAG: helix-turn-helix transcriptional regulator [Fuscovulum sp.]
MTKLRTFLSQSGTTQAELAKEVGVSRPYMSELVGGTKIPSLENAVAIERATNGAVPASSWINSQRASPNG